MRATKWHIQYADKDVESLIGTCTVDINSRDISRLSLFYHTQNEYPSSLVTIMTGVVVLYFCGLYRAEMTSPKSAAKTMTFFYAAAYLHVSTVLPSGELGMLTFQCIFIFYSTKL